MTNEIRRKILELLEQHRIMTIATLRPDGWPQATTVGYVSEDMTIWFLCGLESQKAKNLALDNRVSITIDHDTPDIMAIAGLSMSARAHRVTGLDEANKVLAKLPLKYADAPAMSPPLQMPTADQVALFRVEPEMISVLDYSKGFGHTDLVAHSVEAAPTARGVFARRWRGLVPGPHPPPTRAISPLSFPHPPLQQPPWLTSSSYTRRIA